MSVVVTWTMRGRAAAAHDSASRVPPPVHAPGACRPRAPSRPATLARNHRISSLAWIGERASRYGSVRPYAVGLGAGERGRAEPRRAPARSAPADGSDRLRVREVRRRHAEVVLDRVVRPVELVGDAAVGAAGRAARGCACGSRRSPGRWPPCRCTAAHDIGGTPYGNSRLLVEERGREVDRRRDPVAHEDRDRGVGEVGRAVVEGDDDRVRAGRLAAGRAWRARRRASTTRCCAASHAICSSKRSTGRSSSSPEPRPTQW